MVWPRIQRIEVRDGLTEEEIRSRIKLQMSEEEKMERSDVIIENDDWLYVDVPQGEIGFLMDVEGNFGYVRKTDVTFLPAIPGLDWAE